MILFSEKSLFAISGFKQFKSMCGNYIGIERTVSGVSSSFFNELHLDRCITCQIIIDFSFEFEEIYASI
jgi:hypothetical protein